MSPFGVIDFVDNQCLSTPAAAPGQPVGVVGGPPAYLDAHGIRYVPSASLEAEIPEELVPMSRSALPDPTPVTQRELNSRVDERIRRFMSENGGQRTMSGKAGDDCSRLRDLRDDVSAARLRAERDMDYEDRRSRVERIRAARDRYDEDYESMRASAGGKGADGAADLRALRVQMEEEAAAVRGDARKLSQPVAAKVGKAREELRRGRGIDF